MTQVSIAGVCFFAGPAQRGPFVRVVSAAALERCDRACPPASCHSSGGARAGFLTEHGLARLRAQQHFRPHNKWHFSGDTETLRAQKVFHVGNRRRRARTDQNALQWKQATARCPKRNVSNCFSFRGVRKNFWGSLFPHARDREAPFALTRVARVLEVHAKERRATQQVGDSESVRASAELASKSNRPREVSFDRCFLFSAIILHRPKAVGSGSARRVRQQASKIETECASARAGGVPLPHRDVFFSLAKTNAERVGDFGNFERLKNSEEFTRERIAFRREHFLCDLFDDFVGVDDIRRVSRGLVVGGPHFGSGEDLHKRFWSRVVPQNVWWLRHWLIDLPREFAIESLLVGEWRGPSLRFPLLAVDTVGSFGFSSRPTLQSLLTRPLGHAIGYSTTSPRKARLHVSGRPTNWSRVSEHRPSGRCCDCARVIRFGQPRETTCTRGLRRYVHRSLVRPSTAAARASRRTA